MRATDKFVLSIAGFDPSGGAGIFADIKTFEASGVYGLGVCSALTFQNDVEFEKVEWIAVEKIIEQIKILQKRFQIDFVKIGLIENLDVLEIVINNLKLETKNLKLIWDPILTASAGFIFHKNIDKKKLESVYKKLFLLTPNIEEAKKLTGIENEMEAAKYLSQFCNVLLKGGHNENGNANDILFTKDEQTIFEGEKIKNKKHGSGCVLSSVILANLAQGKNLENSCREAKVYVARFLKSSDTLLGFHKKSFATNFTN